MVLERVIEEGQSEERSIVAVEKLDALSSKVKLAPDSSGTFCSEIPKGMILSASLPKKGLGI